MIEPTRRLNAKKRAVFDRVLTEFDHLRSSDAEMLTQYAETVARYEAALKGTEKHPTITAPVINRASGNVTGEKQVRNPAYVTLREAQSAMSALARRLMIDATSADKRQRLATKKLRAIAALKDASESAPRAGFTETQIRETVKWLRKVTGLRGENSLRNVAIWHLEHPATDTDEADFMAQWLYNDDDGTRHAAPTAEQIINFHTRNNGN